MTTKRLCFIQDFAATAILNDYYKSLEYAASLLKYWSKRHSTFAKSPSTKQCCLSSLDGSF